MLEKGNPGGESLSVRLASRHKNLDLNNIKERQKLWEIVERGARLEGASESAPVTVRDHILPTYWQTKCQITKEQRKERGLGKE